MNILYSLSRNLYPQLKGAIASLLDHNDSVKIYIMAEDSELPFEIPCEHRILNVSRQQVFTEECPNISSRFTYLAMMRVCTPELIPEDRIIQLDVDTIVCDTLQPIWETDMTGKWVGWVRELKGKWEPFGKPYYNFGVAALNLKQMRQDNTVEFMVKALNSIKTPYIDQDIMNMFAVPDRTVSLDMRYNECFCCGETANPAIVHYAGYKDWAENPDMPRREYLDRYR